MKPTEIDLKLMISEKYLMPEAMIETYMKIINQSIPAKKIGRPRADLERILQGIYYVLKTGIPWQALPYIFGNPKTVYEWFSRLSFAGVFDQVWTEGVRLLQKNNKLKLQHQSIDSTHRKALHGGSSTGPSPVDRAKPGSKIILQVEEQGLPLGLTISSSNRNDQILLKDTFLDSIKRFDPEDSEFLHTDKGFDSKKNAKFVKKYSMERIAPRRKYKKKKLITPETLRDEYRWVVERSIAWLVRFRRVFIRYDRIPNHYVSWCQLAAQTLCFLKL